MRTFKTSTDIKAFEQTPLSERRLPDSTYEMILKGAAINPKAVALEFFLQGTEFKSSVPYSYARIVQEIHRAANMFLHLGIGKNDVVSMLLPSVPQAHFTIWGAEAVGIVNPINPLLEAKQIAEIMNAAQTKVLVTVAPFPKVEFIWEKVLLISEQVPTLEHILTVDLNGFLSGFKKGMVKLITFKQRRQMRLLKQPVQDFDRLAAQFPGDKLQSKRMPGPNDTASMFHTGGTTGKPKLALHTHRNEVFDAWALGIYQNMNPGFTLFCGLPLFHVNAVIVTGLMPFGFGATVVLGTPAGYRGEGVVENFWNIVEHYKLNSFSGVPTLFSALLNVSVNHSDISSLQYAACGAAPMPVEVFNEFEKRIGIPIVEGYGLTEGTCVSSVNPKDGERRVGSVGFPLPYQPIKIAELDENQAFVRTCRVNEIGAVLIRGANVFPGYTEEAHNKNLWVHVDKDETPWLNTGDLGRIDAEGYLWLTGRKKELIIRGGHNIDPRLIEDPLHEHPAVALAAAVGRPDARVGELPVAYVQLETGVTATVDELLAFAKERITERAAIPKDIIVIDEMPLTTVGKIFKPQLVWLETQHVYAQTLEVLDEVAQAEVIVGADTIHGMLATITVRLEKDVQKQQAETKIRRALGVYTIPYELRME